MKCLDRRPWPVRSLESIDASSWGALLLPLSWLYLAAAAVHRRLRPARPLPARPPSLGIGNLRLGGTGKTPVAEDLARRLGRGRGLDAQVLTRGYGAEGGGDEVGWLQGRGHRVVQDADRRRGHAAAVAGGAELLLLDDSLQTRHRPTVQLALLLEEDLESMPRPVPAGLARETRGGLSRADALCVRVEGDWPPEPARLERMKRALPRAGLMVFRLAPRGWLDSMGHSHPLSPLPEQLEGACLAVSGLARPQSFERDLVHLLPALVASLRFADHARFDARQSRIIDECMKSEGAAALVVPEKNRERIVRANPGLPVWALQSEIDWLEDPLPWLEERLFPKV